MGAKFGLNVLARQVDEEAKKAVTQVDNLMTQAISASRSLSVELSPPILHDAGLAAGLDWLARWMEEKHGLKIEIKAPEADEKVINTGEVVRLLLFQSIRELLFNIVKHAKVTNAKVELAHHDAKHIRVVVSDMGVGFDPANAFTGGSTEGGMGLYSIRERMTMMGGTMQIESSPGNGSRFVLVAPLEKEKKPAPAAQPPRS